MQGQRSFITSCRDNEFVENCWWTDHSGCEIFKPISEEEFLRRCANKTNLKDIERALQLRALVTEVTLRSDHDDYDSPESTFSMPWIFHRNWISLNKSSFQLIGKPNMNEERFYSNLPCHIITMPSIHSFRKHSCTLKPHIVLVAPQGTVFYGMP